MPSDAASVAVRKKVMAGFTCMTGDMLALTLLVLGALLVIGAF